MAVKLFIDGNYSVKVTLSPHSGLVDSEFSAVRKTVTACYGKGSLRREIEKRLKGFVPD